MSDVPQNPTAGIEQAAVEPVSRFWQPVWQFAVHALVGSAIFTIIATPAVALELGLRKLKTFGVGTVIIVGLHVGEYALFGADLVLLCVFLGRTLIRAAKQL